MQIQGSNDDDKSKRFQIVSVAADYKTAGREGILERTKQS